MILGLWVSVLDLFWVEFVMCLSCLTWFVGVELVDYCDVYVRMNWDRNRILLVIIVARHDVDDVIVAVVVVVVIAVIVVVIVVVVVVVAEL